MIKVESRLLCDRLFIYTTDAVDGIFLNSISIKTQLKLSLSYCLCLIQLSSPPYLRTRQTAAPFLKKHSHVIPEEWH
jgi:hypothetical protein